MKKVFVVCLFAFAFCRSVQAQTVQVDIQTLPGISITATRDASEPSIYKYNIERLGGKAVTLTAIMYGADGRILHQHTDRMDSDRMDSHAEVAWAKEMAVTRLQLIAEQPSTCDLPCRLWRVFRWPVAVAARAFVDRSGNVY